MFIDTNISLSLKVTIREGGGWGGREGCWGAAKIQRSAGSLKFDPKCPE